jgi:eukaryotic-like serine/threonine-protein kinase
VAKHRSTQPAVLGRLVRGDLDWIVMKCLEKDRKRRYETSHALAQDVARHLSDEPVFAAPPSLGYVLTKFVSRHRVGLIVAAALAATLLLGFFVGGWWAVHVIFDRLLPGN